MRSFRVHRWIDWKYAIGELALIVLGILIALAAADWNERRSEVAILKEIRNALVADGEALESGLARLRIGEARIVSLRSHLQETSPYYESLDALFGAVYGIHVLQLNTAACEALKARGLDLIGNEVLRLEIIRLFDQLYENIEAVNDIEMAINLDILRPYYLANFRDIDCRESATPLDYQALWPTLIFTTWSTTA